MPIFEHGTESEKNWASAFMFTDNDDIACLIAGFHNTFAYYFKINDINRAIACAMDAYRAARELERRYIEERS